MADALQDLAAEIKTDSVPSTSESPDKKSTEIIIDLNTETLPNTAGPSEAQSPTSQETNETPATEVSDIEALNKEFSTIKKSVSKENARAKAATLSLVEQVSQMENMIGNEC